LRPARLRSQLLPTPKQGFTAREGPSTPCLRRAPQVGVRPPCMLPMPHPLATTTILASRIFSWGHGAECNHWPVQPTIEGCKVKYQPQNERAGFRRSYRRSRFSDRSICGYAFAGSGARFGIDEPHATPAGSIRRRRPRRCWRDCGPLSGRGTGRLERAVDLRSFFKKYTPDPGYKFGSKIRHGSDLMQLDQGRAFRWDPPWWNEREMTEELCGLMGTAAQN
jgi:hypothetical protein